jgi:uncharacterized membrane protein
MPDQSPAPRSLKPCRRSAPTPGRSSPMPDRHEPSTCRSPSWRLGGAQIQFDRGAEDMSNLVCMTFDDPDTADLALNEIQGMQKGYLVDLQDACVVVRDAGGKVHLKQSVQLLKPAAIGGAGFGASSRAISGATADCGISDDFIQQLGSTIAPDTSARLVRAVPPHQRRQGLAGAVRVRWPRAEDVARRCRRGPPAGGSVQS